MFRNCLVGFNVYAKITERFRSRELWMYVSDAGFILCGKGDGFAAAIRTHKTDLCNAKEHPYRLVHAFFIPHLTRRKRRRALKSAAHYSPK